MIRLAIVGATGLVGTEIIKVLEEFNFPTSELYLCASEKSIGKTIPYKDKNLNIISINELIQKNIDIAIFSAGSEVSKQYAPILSQQGVFVIDNSSQWRLYEKIPLVVPEINAHTINENTRIIANPNCSTIQMVLALAPLHQYFHIKRIVVSTYQSVTGTGMKAVRQLMAERNGEQVEMIYPHPIDLNCFPHGGSFSENGYTTEEWKLINETRKILNDNNIQITATVVRIPVIGGHSESVNVEFYHPFELHQIYQLLQNQQGILVLDNPEKNLYPTPLMAKGKNEVLVGRIRRDHSVANGLNLWIVADNLRKGAATNAVQIALYLLQNYFS
ncbi:MAG: aspartate-semialdehyde dehydrogenase [Bacteroidales bacterium]|nr:aspartate-semialdehyde dehydrogenase [Bacteroidales bacterium]